MYVIGVDFGGGASKATLLDGSGKVVAAACAEYPTYYDENGKAEQNPVDWYNAACENIRRVLSSVNPDSVECICFDAATHVAVLSDGSGKPLCNSIYWTDTRSVAESEYLSVNYGEKIIKKCRNMPDTVWTLPQLMYIKKNFPDIYKKVKRVTFAKDFVRGMFTGDFVTDYIEAEGSMLFGFDDLKWDEELLSLVNLSAGNMPEIVSPLDYVGNICKKASDDSGLPQKVKVICGSTDTAMEVMAAGAINKGDMSLKLATAGRICVVSDKCFVRKHIINYSHLKEGLYYPGSATKSCAASLRWFRDVFGGNYGEFDKIAAEIPSGSCGLIFHPYLTGELTPFGNAGLSGSFIGVRASHTKAHFVRSVMEGVAFSLLDCKLYLEKSGLKTNDSAYVIGGGSKSGIWKQIVSDVLGITLISTRHNDSSFGSAMCAGIAAGYFKDFEEALKVCQNITGRNFPDKENNIKYAGIYKKYKRISGFLTEISK